ncbi:hypothetical protein V2G26_013464 [Clonostachys chloroleuca]|uniref:Peptidase S1 domain-containing protein n=1 Tax=Clonostachys chloroleuca TaxID=1926264 RepID=A0AA35Q6E7_9HYPO|nr:unnamed protein product [Clonostachys chloroleuca]
MAPKLALAAALALPALTTALPTTRDGGMSAFIVGGEKAQAGDFPFIVSLSQSGSHFCGGVLLNANTVLTAAHCSVDQEASSVKVRAGSLTWASGGTQVGVSSITVNPAYDESTISNDVAVWQLAQSIEEGSGISYATLPQDGSDPAANSTVTVAGWGLLQENGQDLPADLMKVSVPVVSRQKCRSQYGQNAITDTMFCAGLEEGGKDSCSGDSGGPIIDESGTLVGLVSWGQGCAQAGFSGVYARLGALLDFINENVNGDGTTPSTPVKPPRPSRPGKFQYF